MSFPLNLPFLGDVRLLLFISSPHLVPLLSPCWDLVDDLMTWPCAKSPFDEWGWILNQLCLQTIRIYSLGPLFYSGSSSSRQIHSITSSPRFPTMDWAFPILNGPNHNHSQSWNVPSFWDIWWYNIIYVLYILCTYVYIYIQCIYVYIIHIVPYSSSSIQFPWRSATWSRHIRSSFRRFRVFSHPKMDSPWDSTRNDGLFPGILMVYWNQKYSRMKNSSTNNRAFEHCADCASGFFSPMPNPISRAPPLRVPLKCPAPAGLHLT